MSAHPDGSATSAPPVGQERRGGAAALVRLLGHMLRTYGRILAAAWRAFGLVSRELIFWALVMPPFLLFTHTTLLLDHVFFPRLRRVRMPPPVFLIGHPRSGTTFVHRLLHATGDYAAFRVRDIIFPALTARRLLYPLLDLLLRRWKPGHDAAGGHAVTPDSVEEEEMLFLHLLDTQFLSFLSPLGLHEGGFAALVENDAQPHRMAAVGFLEGCLRRQCLDSGRSQVIANMNYAALRLRSLLARFPQARVIYILRSPFAAVPSHLSLHRAMFRERWPGLEARRPDLLQGYYHRRVAASVRLYRSMDDMIRDGTLPPDRLLLLRYEEVMADPAAALRQIFEFTGLAPSAALQAQIAEAVGRQRKYVRPHRNADLSAFGIPEAELTRDLADFNTRHGFTPGEPG